MRTPLWTSYLSLIPRRIARVSSLGWLLDEDRLESTGEGRVFFDVLSIFLERRCTDCAQFATREGGFQHVGGVERPPSPEAPAPTRVCNSSMNRMTFAGGFFYFSNDGFQALFKLPAEFCSGDERANVEGHHFFVFE